MAAPKNTAFAESAVTVHVALTSEPGKLPDGSEAWDVESKNMSRGSTLPLADMPPYLSKAIKEGKVPGLIAMTETAAKKASEFYLGSGDASVFIQSEEEDSDPNFPAQEY